MLRLTRSVSFSAAHRYRRQDWSEQRNREAFGPNVALHGHNYRVEVSVSGPLDPETGMSVDLDRLDTALHVEVAARLGWRDLSGGVEGLEGRIPTTENLAIFIWERLTAVLRDMCVERVRVYESPELFVDYEGPGLTGIAERLKP
jgi:6-pyruvoyltetrahydropterin/6-carboxytetrahydropterin synthase